AAAAPVLALVNEQAPLLVRTQPGRPELLENRLQVLARKLLSEKPAAAGDAERRRALAEGLLARQAQRALLAQRQAVAELWLAANRDAQKTLQAAGARVLWEQRDARLDGRSLTELLAVVPAAWDDLRLAVDAGSLGLMRAAGYATPGQLLTGGLFWLVLLAAGIWGTRRLAAADAGGAGGGAAPARWRWLTVRLLPVLPAAAAGGGLLLQALPGNRLALLLGWGLLGLGAWWLCRTLLLAGCPGHRFPPRATLAGGILLAVRLTLGAGILLAVWGGAASGGILAGPRLVLFCLFLLVFWLALVRLALHPLLLGRFLSRRSEHLGLRLFGSLAAGGGILAVMLTVVPFLFTLDNLGRMILQVTVATGLAAALAALLCHACNWLGGLAGPAVPRTEPATAPEPALPAAEETPAAAAGRALLKGLAQTAIAGGATLLILFGWWRLLEMLLLAPDAPPAVRQVAALGAAYGRTALTWWNYPLADRVTVRSLAEGVGVFALFIWLSRVARHVFLRQVLVRTHMDEATRNTLVTVLGYLVVVLGFLVGLNVAGSSLQNLALLAGAITVGLGFGLQNVVNNFVSSLLIHFSRTVRAGDYIDVGGSRGTVREIGFRCTTIVTDDGVTVLVPNGSFIAGNIVNWTNPNPATRLHLPLTVSRGADLAEATRRLTALAAGHALILRQPAPSLEVRAVATGAITVDLLVWTNQPDRQAAILSDLTLACDQELRARNWAAG
ncbi:MAG: mechanosensitive ion channel domain-containing protein, partial [Lentisphaeria bacterium]